MSVEAEADALPRPDDFAGWPALGALHASIAAGPVIAGLERIDSRVAEALAAFPGQAAAGVRTMPMSLEWTRAERSAWLAVRPGMPARSAAWLEGGALAWATHHVALLMDSRAERGIVVLTDQGAEETARSAQNALRVACAWRLAASGRGLLVHAAAVMQRDAAVVFLGPSGAGKSTAARLSMPRRILADDACLLALEPDGARLHPAPFWADAKIAAGELPAGPIRIGCVLRLKQAPSHALRDLPRAAATASLLAHAPFLQGLQPVVDASRTAEALAAGMRIQELEFSKNAGFWSAIDDAPGEPAGTEPTP